MSDFAQVVSHSLRYLRDNNVVGENVIRDLYAKSKQLPCTAWMTYLQGIITRKMYRDMHRLYTESMKQDCGFTRLSSSQVVAIDVFYDDMFMTGEL
ncbi:unnamed protein product [Ectocarpus sp. 6 AP-2014]